jgi:septation ring formation regulator EzrA
MTRFSQAPSDSARDATIANIAEDLRRQRADLGRLQHSTKASSTETAQILEKIDQLRRRMETLKPHDPKDLS